MSTPAAIPQSDGNWTRVPNHFIHNLHRLTPAEERLALIAFMTKGMISVSDRRWEEWTGYSDRHKQNAVKGLARQNFLDVAGHGNSARYKPTFDAWSQHITAHPPTPGKPRTAGRGPSVKTPVMGAHPCCIANGCQIAKTDEVSGQPTSVSVAAQNVVSPLFLVQDRKPVSDLPADAAAAGVMADQVRESPEKAAKVRSGPDRSVSAESNSAELRNQKLQQTAASSEPSKPTKPKSPTVSTEDRKPVSNSTAMGLNPRPVQSVVPKPHHVKKRTVVHPRAFKAPLDMEATQEFWPLAWAVLCSYFGINPTFLSRFIPVWQVAYPELSDELLAATLESTHTRDQRSVGLWVETVFRDLLNRRQHENTVKARAAPNIDPVESALTAVWTEYREYCREKPEPEFLAIVDQLERLVQPGPITEECERVLGSLHDGRPLRRVREYLKA